MRRPMIRMIGRFVIVAVAVSVALAAVWPYVVPAYTSSVGALARPLFQLVESPNRTVVDVQGEVLAIYRIVSETEIQPFQYFDRYSFALAIPLIALFVATPGLGIRRRITRCIGGFVLLWIVQVFYVVLATELDYALFAGRQVGAWKLVLRVLWEAAPILIWVGLTASSWKRVFRSLRSKGIENNESPKAGPIGAEG